MIVAWTERNVLNRVIGTLVLLGRETDGIRILEVPGCRSGRLRRTPVKVLELDSGRYVVSLHGQSGWTRNLRHSPGRPTMASLRIAQWSEPDAQNSRALLNSLTRPE